MKQKLFLCFLAISSIFILTNCDVYRAFKGNRKIALFLNKDFNMWLRDEHAVLSRYNKVIQSDTFSSPLLFQEINTYILPSITLLRERVNKKKLSNSELEKIQKLYLKKLDLLWEAFDLIQDGFNKKDKKTRKENEKEKAHLVKINKGRLLLKKSRELSLQIELLVKKLKKKYYIKLEKKKK